MASVLASLVGCGPAATGQSQAKPPTPTPVPTPAAATQQTFAVQRGEVIEEAEFSGRVVPVLQQELFFRASGRVRNVYVAQYDKVTAGQLLADLESGSLERELATTKLELERQQVAADEAERVRQKDIERAEANLQIAQIGLAQAKAEDPTPRKVQAEAELEKAQLALKTAQGQYDEIKWRGDAGASAQAAALQQATISYSEAKAAYDLALQGIANHDSDIQVKELQVRLAQINLDQLNEQGPDPLLKNNVEQAQLNVQKLEASIADSQIVAPFDGEVLDTSLTEGDAVEAYDPVLVAADPSALEVSCSPSTATSNLTEGMPVSVKFTGSTAAPTEGTIRKLPYLYATSTMKQNADTKEKDLGLRISLKATPEEAKYRLGDVAEVTIVLERVEDALWLPPEAIRTFQDRQFVVVQDGEAQRRVNLRLGIQGTDRVEILEGLEAGQIVLGQ